MGFTSAQQSLQTPTWGASKSSPVTGKSGFFAWDKNENNKTSYGNFPFAKKSYFVQTVTPYHQSKFDSGRRVKAMDICEKLFQLFPHCKSIRFIDLYHSDTNSSTFGVIGVKGAATSTILENTMHSSRLVTVTLGLKCLAHIYYTETSLYQS